MCNRLLHGLLSPARHLLTHGCMPSVMCIMRLQLLQCLAVYLWDIRCACTCASYVYCRDKQKSLGDVLCAGLRKLLVPAAVAEVGAWGVLQGSYSVTC
mgnify:CR=1 FL=1